MDFNLYSQVINFRKIYSWFYFANVFMVKCPFEKVNKLRVNFNEENIT
jgi:hypothetical protein